MKDTFSNLPIARCEIKLKEQKQPSDCEKFFRDMLQISQHPDTEARLTQAIFFASWMIQKVLGTGVTLDEYSFCIYNLENLDAAPSIKLPYFPLVSVFSVDAYSLVMGYPGSRTFRDGGELKYQVRSEQAVLQIFPPSHRILIHKDDDYDMTINCRVGYEKISEVPQDILHIALILVRDIYTDTYAKSAINHNFYQQNIIKRIRNLAQHRTKYRI